MKTKQIIKTLQEYNDWRRSRGKWDVDAFNAGESLFDTISAHQIGLTLDAAIEQLQTLEQEREEALEIARTAIQNIETAFGIFMSSERPLPNKPCGQTVGHESWRLIFTGNQAGAVEDAIQAARELHGFDRLNYLDKGNK